MPSPIKRKPSRLHISVLPLVVEAAESSDGLNTPPLPLRRVASFAASPSPSVATFADSTKTRRAQKAAVPVNQVKRRATEPSLREFVLKTAAQLAFHSTGMIYNSEKLPEEALEHSPPAPPSTPSPSEVPQPRMTVGEPSQYQDDDDQRFLASKARKRRAVRRDGETTRLPQPRAHKPKQVVPTDVEVPSDEDEAFSSDSSYSEDSSPSTGTGASSGILEQRDAEALMKTIRTLQELDTAVSVPIPFALEPFDYPI